MGVEQVRRCEVCGATLHGTAAEPRALARDQLYLPRLFLGYDATSANPLYHFVSGIRLYLAGFGFLLANRGLKRLALIPVLITVVILIGLLVGGYYLADYLLGSPEPGVWAGLLAALGRVAVLIVLIVVVYFLFFPLASLILAPFNERLSMRVEQIILPTHKCVTPPGRLQWLRALLDGVRLLVLQAVVLLVLLPFNLVPVIGSVPTLIALIYFASLDYMDVPASVKRYSLRDKLRLISRNKALTLGFGATAYVLLLVPGVNLLSIPVGVTAATLLFLRLPK